MPGEQAVDQGQHRLEMSEVVAAAAELESLASEIYADRQEIIELDRARQSIREASTGIRCRKGRAGRPKKMWVCCGDTFLRLSEPTVSDILKSDAAELDSAIDEMRTSLSKKAARLHQLEGHSSTTAEALSRLSPLSRSDLKFCGVD